jgi:hypothetical protein
LSLRIFLDRHAGCRQPFAREHRKSREIQF